MTQTALTQPLLHARLRAATDPAELSSPSSAPPALPRRPRRVLPAALEWQDLSLPGIGRVRAAWWAPAALLAACAVALIYLAQTSGVATTGYDIQRLQAERSAWTLRNEQLKLELTKLHSLAWVESEAVRRFGMQRAESVTHLRSMHAHSGR